MTERRSIPSDLAGSVRREAGDRCGYCLSPQSLTLGRLHIEHIIPLAAGGTNERDNLWLACSLCNGHKADKTMVRDPVTDEDVRLFNPRLDDWFEHFEWSTDGIRVVGLTPIGRATVSALQLDSDPTALTVRANWVAVGLHPPQE